MAAVPVFALQLRPDTAGAHALQHVGKGCWWRDQALAGSQSVLPLPLLWTSNGGRHEGLPSKKAMNNVERYCKHRRVGF